MIQTGSKRLVATPPRNMLINEIIAKNDKKTTIIFFTIRFMNSANRLIDFTISSTDTISFTLF